MSATQASYQGFTGKVKAWPVRLWLSQRVSPAAIPGPRVAVAVPAAPAPPAPERLGYPEVLRDADVVTLLSRALPGLAAMFGMTALGGVLGYRQARAGYLLRAAGTGRFLR